MKKRLSLLLALLIMCSTVTCYAVDGWTDNQIKAHEIATTARSMGLAENNPIIVEASRIWFDEMKKIEEANAAEREHFLNEHYTDAVMMAKVMYCEARGIGDKRELSMICWTILNRLDSGNFQSTIPAIITARWQFAYRPSAPMVNDKGVDLFALAQDVLLRWKAEKDGAIDVGRTLPPGWCFYKGDGYHNYFQMTDKGKKYLWFEGYGNPYE